MNDKPTELENLTAEFSNASEDFTTDDFSFTRKPTSSVYLINNRRVKRGTADQYNYVIERKLVHGVMRDVKVYPRISVKNNIRDMVEELDWLDELENELGDSDFEENVYLGESKNDE